jgi:hypothetical protein
MISAPHVTEKRKKQQLIINGHQHQKIQCNIYTISLE